MPTADEGRIAALRDDLMAGRLTAAAGLFDGYGVDPPIVVWNPEPHAVPTPQLSFLLRYWLGLQDSAGRVAPDRIDPLQMRPALGHIMLLDVLDGGANYRYRVYGSEIAQRSGFDMTGKCTSELPTGTLASLFFIAVYQAVLLRSQPVYTWHQMPVDITVNTWHRLVLPLHGPDGTVTRLLAGNVGTDFDRRAR